MFYLWDNESGNAQTLDLKDYPAEQWVFRTPHVAAHMGEE